MEILYGKNSYVEITNLNFSTNTKNYLVDCKLYVGNVELFEEVNLEGLNYLISESFKWIGTEKIDLILSTTLILD